jgi:hypothetical protein
VLPELPAGGDENDLVAGCRLSVGENWQLTTCNWQPL